jgi:hypothetical protein
VHIVAIAQIHHYMTKTMETKRNRRQFSIRALLLASAFIALIFGLIVRIESANAREQKLISQLRSMDVGKFGSIAVWPKGLPMCGMGMTAGRLHHKLLS